MKRTCVLLILACSTLGLLCASVQPFYLYHDVDFESSIIFGFYSEGNPVVNNRVDAIRGNNEINILATYNAATTIDYTVSWTELVNTYFTNPATAPALAKLDYTMYVTGVSNQVLFNDRGEGSIKVSDLELSYNNQGETWNKKSICNMRLNILPNAGKFGGNYQGTITLEVATR